MDSESDLLVRALRTRWWVAAVVVVASLGAARYFTARETPVYRATAESTVMPAPNLKDTGELLRALETLERRTVIATFALLPGSRETRAEAAQELGVDTATLRSYRITASVVPSTNVLRIRVDGPDAVGASNLANAVAHVTAMRAAQMYRLFALQPLDASIPAGLPVSPNAGRNLAVAGILGLFLGLALSVGVEVALSLVGRPGQRNEEHHAVLRSA